MNAFPRYAIGEAFIQNPKDFPMSLLFECAECPEMSNFSDWKTSTETCRPPVLLAMLW